MEAKLLVVGGKASKGSVSLKLPTVIGRARDATLTVAHPMISRRHCEIYEVDGLLMIRDLGSLNGTVVGKQRVKVAPLPPDSQFTIGPLTFQTVYEYAGSLDNLPAPVLDSRQSAGAAKEAANGLPDFEEADDAVALDDSGNAVDIGLPADDPMSGSDAHLNHGGSTVNVPPSKEITSHGVPHTAVVKAKASPASPAKRSAGAAAEKAPAKSAPKEKPTETKPVAKAASGKEPDEDPFDAFLNELG